MPSAAGIYFRYFNGGVTNEKLPPLVLIHGAGGTHLHWPHEMRRMRDFEIYALDLPGHGRSEGDLERSIEGYASRLIAWMEALDLTKAVLAGHSMGGGIALTASIQNTDRVAGMVLVGSGARLRVHPQILSMTGSEATYQQAAGLVTTWAFSSQTDVRIKALALSRMAKVPAHVVHSDFLACDSFDLMERLGEITVPCLILCGTQDQLTPVKYSSYLLDHLPDAQLEVIEGAGHMVMLEKPEALLAPLRTFLMKL